MKRHKIVSDIIIAVLVIGMVFLGIYIVSEVREYIEADSVYNEAASSMPSLQARLVFNDDIPEGVIPESASSAAGGTSVTGGASTGSGSGTSYTITVADISALQAINPDVVGWIQIPGTAVNYPVIQSADSDYYLHHLYNGQYSSSGSIFVDPGITDYLNDRNCIIYGHNMRNGSMFRALNNYTSSSYLNNHPYVYMTDTDGTIYVYRIFSVYRANYYDVDYRYGFAPNDVFQTYLDSITARSIYKTGVTADKDNYIITLSTCSGAQGTSVRMIIHAVWVGTAETE